MMVPPKGEANQGLLPKGEANQGLLPKGEANQGLLIQLVAVITSNKVATGLITGILLFLFPLAKEQYRIIQELEKQQLETSLLVRDREAQLNNCRNDSDDLQTDIDDKRLQVRTLNSQIRAFEANVANLNSQLSDLKASRRFDEQKIARLEEEVKDTQAALRLAEEQGNLLISKLTEAQDEVHEAKHKFTQALNDRKTPNTIIAKAYDKLQKAQDSLAKKKLAIFQQDQIINRLSLKLKEREKQITKKANRERQLEGLLNYFSSVIEKYRKEAIRYRQIRESLNSYSFTSASSSLTGSFKKRRQKRLLRRLRGSDPVSMSTHQPPPNTEWLDVPNNLTKKLSENPEGTLESAVQSLPELHYFNYDLYGWPEFTGMDVSCSAQYAVYLAGLESN